MKGKSLESFTEEMHAALQGELHCLHLTAEKLCTVLKYVVI